VRIFFSNLGCKLNQAEVDAMARRFLARGHDVVATLEEADLHVVNTCTVTQQAARDSRRAARRARREGLGVRTVLTGCWATAEVTEAGTFSGVDLVVVNGDKDRLVEIADRAFSRADTVGTTTPPRSVNRTVPPWTEVPVSYVPLQFGPARALLKVEDGCDMRCAFCIIPRTRGRERSRPLDDVVAEARALEAAGHAEIVVTGVQISAYRDGAARLPELLDALMRATSTARLRLTSIAPWELDEATLDRLDHPRVCRHVHLSLQSGHDLTLRRMRRPYTAARFASLVDALRRRVPGIAITTDVIVGFPGETDDEHEASRAFVGAQDFARVHVFNYSAREGTEAASMPEQVSAAVRHSRMAGMLETAAAAEATFHRAHVGAIARVLWEGRRAGRWLGTTDNYLRVFAHTEAEGLRGTVTETRLIRAVPGGLLAAT
jgi:threonylcarbamoyladenosine tRNA methylthiotransferase MtaB